MSQDLSILHLVLNASIVVQLVMLLLVVISVSRDRKSTRLNSSH